MARKINTRTQRDEQPTIIGAGKTEKLYFTHLKEIYKLRLQIKSRFFGNENIPTLEKRVDTVLDNNGKAIIVFDTDVATWDASVQAQLDKFRSKYSRNPNVVICDSMPSIEYWFLLHFENTNKTFPTSKSVVKVLQKHIPGFEKTETFLQNPKWVKTMCSDNKLINAYLQAKKQPSTQSYTKIWKVFDEIGGIEID